MCFRTQAFIGGIIAIFYLKNALFFKIDPSDAKSICTPWIFYFSAQMRSISPPTLSLLGSTSLSPNFDFEFFRVKKSMYHFFKAYSIICMYTSCVCVLMYGGVAQCKCYTNAVECEREDMPYANNSYLNKLFILVYISQMQNNPSPLIK